MLRSHRLLLAPVLVWMVSPWLASPASAASNRPLRDAQPLGRQAQRTLPLESQSLPGQGSPSSGSGSPGQSQLAAAVSQVGRYAGPQAQLTSLNQLGDLRPSDWAYQALATLVERYGCVAGYSDGLFAGNRTISRFEAAALLNGCLERIGETDGALTKLVQEFRPELAILKGRLDGLDGRVGALEASQFAPTTTLSGLAVFVLGANRFLHTGPVTKPTLNLPSGTTLNYDLELALNTSFRGKDLLRTVLRAGNFGASPFGTMPLGALQNFPWLSQLEASFESDAGANILAIDKLFYQWPLGRGFTATVGARVGQDDMLAMWPSAYPADTILNVMTVNGAPAAYNKNLGPGFGLMWQGKHLSLSTNYVASNGASGDPAQGGLGTVGAGGSRSVQLAYGADQWGLAALYSFVQPFSQGVPGITPFAHRAIDLNAAASTNAYGLSGYWQPLHPGWLPSVSAGVGLNSTSYSGQPVGRLSQSQSWLLALQWKDALAKGNALGIAVGSPVFATSLNGTPSGNGDTTPNDGNTVMEAWYKFQLSDQISLTPALFYLSRPFGQLTPAGQTLSQLGALVKTSFRF